ncbi:MAG: TonB-dependent receptor [Xanthomonadaceae bacterium]|nr:TonB-dependent receptor [Xanthomonadaceae bacterium]MDE1965374.1 TonB-dependent receptor [Xanthomonadaceae bacterium]
MNRKLLYVALGAALSWGVPVAALHAQPASGQDASASKDASSAPSKQKAKKLETITVTGSLLPQAEIETSAPTVQITSKDIESRGYANVYDVLRSQPLATGQVQDSQFTNGFTPGASTISLLGLDPGFTLILLNGHPLADYPLLYNGSSNFTDLSSIPVSMIDHIDILPGNQSAIYGSSAIAGVINIILKDRVEGVNVTARMGGYTEGAGENQRLAVSFGHTWGKFDLTGAVQLEHQAPIWGYDRSYTSSVANNPALNGAAPIAPRDVLILNGNTGKYVDPGQAACNNLSNTYGGTLKYAYRPGSGYYCGSLNEPSYTTFMNGSKAASVYLHSKYHVTDNTTLYGDLLYNHNKINLNSGTRFWFSSIDTGGYFFNANTNRFELWQRIFAPEEIGATTNNDSQTSDSVTVTLGARGTFGQSNWDWDTYYFRSQQQVKDQMLWPLKSKVEQFFLGQQQGTYYGYPVYAPNPSRMYTPLTPADYRGFSDYDTTTSKTYTQNLNLQITNTSLFSLPAGDVGVAGLLQAGEQYWSNPTDPRVIAGDFWGLTGTQGKGTRRNYAAAAEFHVPIFSMLSANLSGRYDKFNYAGLSDSKATYKLGLEFRPFDSLLIRGNYATAFRSPDMGYLFAGPSGYYTSATDYYYCRTQEPNVPISNCSQNNVQISGRTGGNTHLKSITAKSWGYGVVWSPSGNFNIKADYYHIAIKNEVNSLSIDRILQDEANCRIGQSTGGVPYDINSGLCQSEIALVHRNAANAPLNPDGLQAVDTLPINISDETVNGIIASTNWRHDMGRWGELGLGAQYNVLLKHDYRQIAGDPVQNILSLRSYYNGYRQVASANADWAIGKWSFSVIGTRRGATYNYAGTGSVGAWTTYNASVGYKFSDMVDLSLISNNVTNKRPPRDNTFSAYPYYNIFNYNSFGRAVWFQASIHFK